MKGERKWTPPKDLKTQVSRLWDRGLILQSKLSDTSVFPKRLVLRTPNASDLAHAFAEALEWAQGFQTIPHIRIIHREVRNRVTGANTLPVEAWIDSAEEAVSLLGKKEELEKFQRLIQKIQERQPDLLDWIERRPLIALDHFENWDRFLDLIHWIQTNPRPACYLRQVDLPGIDTKFIEHHRSTLAELFDLVLPPEQIDNSATGLNGFCRRYGFLEKPERIRIRVLDPATDPLGIGSHADLTLDLDTFSQLPKPPRNLYITENETNFLAFPSIAESWILFGAGFGLSRLHAVPWMKNCRIRYWGDIDTHGFAALNEVRTVLPQVESILMDEQTLLDHQYFWGQEPKPTTSQLPHLTEPEQRLYQDLQQNRFGTNLRLEQERVGMVMVERLLGLKGK